MLRSLGDKKTRHRSTVLPSMAGIHNAISGRLIDSRLRNIILKTSVEREKDVQAFDVIKESGK